MAARRNFLNQLQKFVHEGTLINDLHKRQALQSLWEKQATKTAIKILMIETIYQDALQCVIKEHEFMRFIIFKIFSEIFEFFYLY